MKNLKTIILSFIQTTLITGITLFSVMPFSCKVTTEGIQLVGGDYASPQIESIEVVNEKSLRVTFSEKVKVSGAVLSPFMEGISDSIEHSETIELSTALKAASGCYGKIPVTVDNEADGESLLFNFAVPTTVGKAYELYAVVEDQVGNTLTFTTKFSGYNPRIPKLIMTEVFISNESSNKTKYRTEFVEFLALSDGNLSNLKLYSASKGIDKGYDFPSVEVRKGEIILVHLRTKGEGCISEEGEDLSLATGGNSNNGVRDLWSANTEACLTKAADTMVLINKGSGQILEQMSYDEFTNEVKSSVTKSLQRQDSKRIYEKMNAEEIEYPLPAGASSWKTDTYSPGTL